MIRYDVVKYLLVLCVISSSSALAATGTDIGQYSKTISTITVEIPKILFFKSFQNNNNIEIYSNFNSNVKLIARTENEKPIGLFKLDSSSKLDLTLEQNTTYIFYPQ